MPQPLTHYLVTQNAMENMVKDLWENNKEFAGFGSFGPDLFYMKDLMPFEIGDEYTEISDIMHWDGSFEYFCNMLDYIKTGNNNSNKLKSYAYGYYSHIVTDAIFHPYIYRKTNDHWKFHKRLGNKNSSKHKELETIIDFYLLNEWVPENNVSPYTFKYYKKIRCYENGSDERLDSELFGMIDTCMRKTYERRVNTRNYSHEILEKGNYNNYFDPNPDAKNDNEYPIHDAYDDFVFCTKIFYNIKYIEYFKLLAKASDTLKALIPKVSLSEKDIEKMNNSHIPWPNSNRSLNYSVSGLYNKALRLTKQIIKTGEDFFNNSSASMEAHNFFDSYSNNHIYLRKNINIDTGLLSSYNNDITALEGEDCESWNKKKKEHIKWLKFNVDELVEQYNAIEV